uniref:Uncharacterized protein n=1 Tax=Sphaerodactylus townsendi TaxID=933632 RepID=A0ACB8FLE5_9SAUR
MPRSPASSNHEPPEQPPPQPQPRWEPEKAERRRPREEEEEEQEEEEEEEEEGDEAATEEEEEEEEAEAADGAEQPPLAAPCLLNGQPGGESREGSPKDEAPLYETIKPPAAAGSAPPASPPGRMDQPAPHALVVRIGIPDLQQTGSILQPISCAKKLVQGVPPTWRRKEASVACWLCGGLLLWANRCVLS